MKRSVTYAILILFTNICMSQSLISEQNQVDKSNTFVDALFEDLLKKTKLPGVAITISKDGHYVYSKGFGFANREKGIKMQPTTQIRAASVSKVITATALGRLATNGKLDFDAPIIKYIPYLKAPFANITTRQLAGHTSGIQHRPSKKSAKNKDYNSVKELVGLVEKTSLKFEPDTDYMYSTLAYNLLAGVIEGASNVSFEAYMRDSVFTPLKMHQTFLETSMKLSANDARMYYFKNDKLVRDKKVFKASYKLPGAGFRSTSNDLAKMMDAYSNGFISKEIADEMFTSNILKNGSKTNVGIGWRLNRDIANRPTIEHAGSWQGARTVIVHYPDENLTISMMVNAQCVLFIEETVHLIAQLFLSKRELKTTFNGSNYNLNVTIERSNGSKDQVSGKLNFSENSKGNLLIDTKLRFLQKNSVYRLGVHNYHALSTEFGLLSLKLNANPVTGKVYLYQTLKDAHHFSKEPMVSFTSK